MRLISWSVVLVLGSSLGANAQQPYLVKDINPTVDVANITNPFELTAGANGLYFGTIWGVWRTDGTPSGTTLTRDLLANGVLEVTSSGPLVYFVGDGSLWRTDGTNAGTTRLITGVGVSDLANVNGRLFFNSTGGLWKSDGTIAGTVAVAPVVAEHTIAVGDRAFFVSDQPGTGRELWVSDGTAAGTHLIADVCPGDCTGVYESSGFAVVGGVLYFVGSTGTASGLWRTDGTMAGTWPVVNMAVGTLHANGALVFFGSGYDGLWRSDGTLAGTVHLRADLLVERMHTVGSITLFSAREDATGRELWRTDGTVAGTSRITDGCPGPCDWLDEAVFPYGPPFFGTVGPNVIFTRAKSSEIWRSDGTAAGTQPVVSFSEVRAFETFGGHAYFNGDDGSHGNELWRTDGTAAGTTLITDAIATDASIKRLGVAGGRVFFQGFRSDLGPELWSSQGTAATTHFVDIVPGPEGSYPGSTFGGQAAPLGDALVFTSWVQGVTRPWLTDGTPNGTVKLAETRADGPVVSSAGLAFFSAGNLGSEPWRTDGTPSGTFELSDLHPGPSGSKPYGFSPIPGRVVFGAEQVAGDPFPHYALLSTDGSPGSARRLLDTYCFALRAVEARVFMRCFDPSLGYQLWTTDGTVAGTTRVTSLLAPTGLDFLETAALEGTFYFTGHFGAPEEELWKSDGTDAGTVRVATIFARNLVASNGLVFFYSWTSAQGGELWKSDGTPGGTSLVRDIAPGPDTGLDMRYAGITPVPGGVVFSGYTGTTGAELWFSDGTAAGSVPLGEVEPGPLSSSPVVLDVLDGRVYFTADRADVGRELWAVDLPTAVLSAGDATVTEGDAGTTSVTFTVALSAPTAVPVTVAYTTVAGTAAAGTDFQPRSGTLTFAAGSAASIAVEVPIVGDQQDEPVETFTLELGASTGAAVADGRALGAIVDDDGPTVTLTGPSIAEGDTGTTAAPVTATLTTKDGAPAPTAKVITFATQDGGTASAGVDFDPASGAITFPAGTTSGTAAAAVLQVRGDTLDEPDEAFAVRFQGTGDEGIPVETASVHIEDDDGIDAAAPTEIAPGSVLRADLTPPVGRATDRDYYVMLQQPQSSYEVVIDETSADAVPLLVQRVASDGSTVLQTAAPTGTGASLSLRWQNTSSAAIPDQHLAVSSASCGTACAADDRYRLRVYETTLSAPRFNNVNGQGTVVLLQNRSDQPVSGRLLFWMPAGWLGHEQPFTVPARGAIAINTLAIIAASGSLTVTHDGPYGALVGKAVSLEPATGFSFDTPLTSRPR